MELRYDSKSDEISKMKHLLDDLNEIKNGKKNVSTISFRNMNIDIHIITQLIKLLKSNNPEITRYALKVFLEDWHYVFDAKKAFKDMLRSGYYKDIYENHPSFEIDIKKYTDNIISFIKKETDVEFKKMGLEIAFKRFKLSYFVLPFYKFGGQFYSAENNELPQYIKEELSREEMKKTIKRIDKIEQYCMHYNSQNFLLNEYNEIEKNYRKRIHCSECNYWFCERCGTKCPKCRAQFAYVAYQGYQKLDSLTKCKDIYGNDVED